mgnify:CR=1 FL=1
MGTKAQALLNRASCLNRAGDDEPIFILRAKDPLAAQTVRLWASMAADGTHSPEKVKQALDVAETMDRWHTNNMPAAGTPA